MIDKRNVPEIRFKGFDGEWEERKLGDVAEEYYGGGTPRTAATDYWSGNIPWIQSSDIPEGQLSNIEPRKMITEQVIKSSATKLVPENSIAIVTRVGVGKLALMPYKYATSQDFLSLSKLKVDSWFATYLIWKKIQGELHSVQGTSIKGITKEELLSKAITVATSEKEQSRIGTFFQNLDSLITLHQRKCDKLTTVKKAMLEKMFPKDGTDTPEIRFKGFMEKWELRQVGDVIEDYIEKTTKQNQYPVLTSSQQLGIVLQESYFANRQVTTDKNIGYFVLPKGYFTYRSRSDTDLFVFNRNNIIDKGVISYFYPVFKAKDADSDFFLIRINYGTKQQLAMAAEGTGQRVLSHTKFKKMTLLFPLIEEQKQIGTFFQNLDSLITLHQRELDKLKNIKKACLGKMFV